MQPNLPHDPEAEWAILALTITDPERARELVRLPSGVFYEPLYRKLFKAIKKLYFYGKPISLPSVKEVLAAQEELTEEIEEILLNMSVRYTLADVPLLWDGYVSILLDKYAKRKAIEAAEKIQEYALRGLTDAVRIAEFMREQMKAYEADVGVASTGVITGEDLANLLQHTPERLKIGYSLVDDVVGGFERGEFVIFAARPGVGKTALLLEMAWAASEFYPVLFVSREMSEYEIGKRLERIAGNTIQEELSQRQFFLTTAASNPLQIRLTARKVGAVFVFVDYVQRLLPESNSRYRTREQEVGEISAQLKDMALDENMIVVAAAQLNRESEKRQDRRPYLVDLRDSGRLEQDANLIWLLWRDTLEDEEPYTIYWHLAKNRRGPTAEGQWQFVPSEMKFFSVG